MPRVSRLEVIETGARRRWSVEEKQRIVAESLSVPRNVSATARRYGLSNGQLFTWCRLARAGKLALDGDAGGFVAAIVAPQGTQRGCNHEVACSGEVAACDRIEIVLSEPRRVIVGKNVDAVALKRALWVLEDRAVCQSRGEDG